ncbi:MAG: XRE family transcriptional regulator [Dongiaceae bacterium]
MEPSFNRIRDIRLGLDLTMQELADRIGTSKAQIDKLEKGERRLTVDWMRRIAAGLGCDISELLPETAQNTTALPEKSISIPPHLLAEKTDFSPLSKQFSRDLPVLGAAKGGKEGFFLSNGDIHEMIERPSSLNGVKNAFAVYVNGESMEPRFFPGEVLYINPNRPLSKNCFVVVELKDGQGLVKQYLKEEGAALILKQFNPAQEITIPRNRVKSIYRVIGVQEYF